MDPLTERLGLLVIGSGPAGVHAATAYVESGGPGPVCLVSADVDPPYQRPPLSKDVLAGDEPPEVTPILDDDDAHADVEVRLAARVESTSGVRSFWATLPASVTRGGVMWGTAPTLPRPRRGVQGRSVPSVLAAGLRG